MVAYQREWVAGPLDNAVIRSKLEDMLNGNYNFSCDELPTVVSDEDTKLYLSFIDAIKFTVLNPKLDKPAKASVKRRSKNPSAFFPYRLNKEWKEFELYTNDLAIGHVLYDNEKGCMQKWLKESCLVYAIRQHGIFAENILDEINRKLIGSKYIGSDKLTEIANIFNIRFVLRSVDNERGKVEKGNKSNEGAYGRKDALYTIYIARYEQHYFIFKEVPVSSFVVKNWKAVKEWAVRTGRSFDQACLAVERRGSNFKINTKKAHMTTLDLVRELMAAGAFTPLMRNDHDVDLACVHEWSSKSSDTTLAVNRFNYRVIKPQIASPQAYNFLNKDELSSSNIECSQEITKEAPSYWYADFETCTYNNREYAFMVCVQSEDGSVRRTFTSLECAEELMEFLPHNSVVYFHNLGFDGRLLMKHDVTSNIMKGSKIITQKHKYKGKKITLNDSYSLFPQALKRFPAAFKKEFEGLNIQKELMPYRYYKYERIVETAIGIISEVGYDELPAWTQAQRDEFVKNIDSIPGCRLDADTFDMKLYCEFYCQQDVNVLRIGFNAFREAALKEPICVDVHTVKTAPSLANTYLNNNVFHPNGKLYEYSGTLQDYIQGAVYGGRCMTKQNKRWKVSGVIDDFDACSLYPSAMARLFTVEGIPELIPAEHISEAGGLAEGSPEASIYSESRPHWLLKHAFTEDQRKPTKDKFISQFIVDIEIVSIGIERDFPLIVYRTL